MLHNTHESPLLSRFDTIELHGEGLSSFLDEVLGVSSCAILKTKKVVEVSKERLAVVLRRRRWGVR